MDRLASVIHRLKLAADALSDFAITMPTGEHGSAAFVVAKATKDLNQLYYDLDAWEITHDFTQRDTDTHARTVLSSGEVPVV